MALRAAFALYSRDMTKNGDSREKDGRELNAGIMEEGRGLLRLVEGEKPSLFEEGRWAGKMMAWAMRDETFRVNLFRFVDVFPSLSTRESLMRHLVEYFGDEAAHLPEPVRLGLKLASGRGRLRNALAGRAIRYAVEKLGRQFIVGENPSDALKGLSKIRREGTAFSVDLLGEAVVSEDEAAEYWTRCMALLTVLEKARAIVDDPGR